jgi:hypothetical protein
MQKAVQVPEWFNGVDCKSIVRRFESYPALKIGDIMKVVELVNKLEEIEKRCKGEARDLCGQLIDDIIEWDMRMASILKNTNKKIMKEMEQEGDEFIKFLMKEGIESGSIGEA